MGTKHAPRYANIFMGIFEERYIYPLIETTSKFYLQFIMYFFIWTGTTDQLIKFKQQVNGVYPSIKFVFFSFSNKEISFLDTVAYKMQKGKLETKLYRKESN